jgi:hypothetical protein
MGAAGGKGVERVTASNDDDVHAADGHPDPMILRNVLGTSDGLFQPVLPLVRPAASDRASPIAVDQASGHLSTYTGIPDGSWRPQTRAPNGASLGVMKKDAPLAVAAS